MQRTAVTSSQIKSVGYDPASRTLEVEFTKGAVYQYFDVPEAMYRDLIEAESIGKYFNQFIKYGKEYKRIPQQTEGGAA